MRIACLISQQGSGTNLFRSFFNSHPDIVLHDEILTKATRLKSFKTFMQTFKKEGRYFDKCHKGKYDEDKKPPAILGFDLKYNNIQSHPEILQWLESHDAYIIHLKRCKGRTFLRNMNEQNRATLSFTQFQEHLGFVEGFEWKIKDMFGKNNLRYLEVTYEDMTRGKEIEKLPLDFQNSVLSFLELNGQDVPLKQTGSYIRKEKLFMRY